MRWLRQCGAAHNSKRDGSAPSDDVRTARFSEPGIAVHMCASAQTTLPRHIYGDLIR